MILVSCFVLCVAVLAGLASHEMSFFFFGMFVDNPPTSLQISFCVFSCLSSALFIVVPVVFPLLQESDRKNDGLSISFAVFWLSVKAASILVSRSRYNRFFINTQIPIVVFSVLAALLAISYYASTFFEQRHSVSSGVPCSKSHFVIHSILIFLAPLLAFSWIVMGLWAGSYITYGFNYPIVWLPLLLRFADIALPSLELCRFTTLVSQVIWHRPTYTFPLSLSPFVAMVLMSGTFLGMNPHGDPYSTTSALQETGFIFGMIGTIVGCVFCALLVFNWFMDVCCSQSPDGFEAQRLVNTES